MTVVAGASLFSGVMLVADSWITVRRAGCADVHADICQKIFPLTNSLVIGFAGDVYSAAFILTELRAQLAKRERRDVVSLVLRWLSRFLKARYAKYAKDRPIHFMVAAVRLDRPNFIERQKVVDIMRTIAAGKASIQRNHIPDVVARMMLTPPLDPNQQRDGKIHRTALSLGDRCEHNHRRQAFR